MVVRRFVENTIEVRASRERVWAVLVDFEAYPAWNPFMRRIIGDARVGSRLSISLTPPVGRMLTVKPSVQAADPGRRLGWRGRLAVPGLFAGEHIFDIEPLGEGVVRVVHRGWYWGLLVRFFGRTLDRTASGFEHMNHALKRRAESLDVP